MSAIVDNGGAEMLLHSLISASTFSGSRSSIAPRLCTVGTVILGTDWLAVTISLQPTLEASRFAIETHLLEQSTEYGSVFF